MSYSVCFSFHKLFSVSHHISCPTMWLSPFPRCQFACHIPGATVCNFHFSFFSNFSCHLPGHAVFFLIFHVFQFSRQNLGPTVCISQYFMYSTLSLQISGPTVCASHTTYFSVIFAIIHVLAYEFLIFLVCNFSSHIPGPTM